MPNLQNAFLSHSSQDAELAKQLCDELERRDVRCWIAPRDIPIGRSWADSIMEGIEGCAAFVLLATTRSVLSRDVLIELERAHRLARPIYTIMVDQPRLTGEMTYYLTRLQWLESKRGGMEKAASRLADVLRGTKRWETVATPPSLVRRIRSALPAFTGALTAIFIGLALLVTIVLLAAHRVQRTIALDYRSIGWTTFSNIPKKNASGALVVGHVWMGDANRPFSTVRLHTRLTTTAGKEQRLDLASQLPGDGTGDAAFTLELPPDTYTFTTLLAVPKGSGLLCVTQRFAVGSGQLMKAGEAKVSTVSDVGGCT